MEKKAMIYLGRKPSEALETVRAHSQQVLANYGQSVLVRADEASLKELETAGYRVREMPETPVLQVGGYRVDTTRAVTPAGQAMAPGAAQTSGRGHYLLRLAGPMHPDWKSRLEKMGVVFHQTIDTTTSLIAVDNARLDDLAALDYVEAVIPYYPSLKVNPELLTGEVRSALDTSEAITPLEPPREEPPASSPDLNFAHPRPAQPEAEEAGNLELVLFDPRDQLTAIDAARQAGARVIKTGERAIVVFADLSLVPRLAAIPQVREVNPYRPPRLHNNVATGIIAADILQNDQHLEGSGQIIAIGDSGMDTGVDDASMLADFQGRIVSIHALGRPGDASDPDGHGTHVTGSVLGDGANSNGLIRGIAPAAGVVFQSLMDAGGGLGGIPLDLGIGLFDVARDDGARIHTNSWGADVNGAYNANAGEADTFAFNNRRFLILFSAGNDAPNRVGSPGTAKNVLTVGASESPRPLPSSVSFPASPAFPGGATANNFDLQADNQNQVANFSSLGPAQNNRRKPDVVAPGSWILSTRSSVAVYDSGPDGLGPNEVPPAGTGDEDGTETHEEAVGFGLPGQPVFRAGDQNTPDAPPGSGPAATDNYMYLSGTSMATPITAGACALVRQYLIEQRGHNPSAALVKALMVNGAQDMGMGVPDNGQGWGRIDLNSAIFPSGTNRVQFDDNIANAVATGDVRSYDVFVSSAAAPLAVTLVWRDPAGNTIQNSLHLRVTHVDTGVTSVADPIGDIRNNVQKVIVNPPQLGLYQIEVEGVNVATGVPELLPALRQDYALVVANATGFSCNPSDIVQIVDRSGSMGFSGYMEPAKERAKQMIDILQINDQAGVVTFAASATEDFPLTLIDSQDVKDDAHAVIDPISALGTTDLREALEQGLTTLGPDMGRPRAMVFLSDGKHTVATPPVDDLLLDTIAAQGIKVYTIALGPDSDFAVLNHIAALTGTGAVNTVESAADLHKLHEIYYDILGGLGCAGLIHLNSGVVDLEIGMAQAVHIDRTATEAHFALSWETVGAAFDYVLRDPVGNIIDPASKQAYHFEGSSHRFYRVPQPMAGEWTMLVKPRKAPGNRPPRVTTAALADSAVECAIRLDPDYLIHNLLLLSLKVGYLGKPILEGKATATITYPTRSIPDLLIQYAEELKRIKIDKRKLGKDSKANLNLIRLGILAARMQARGKDIFERKQVQVGLKDDGKNEDPEPNDGIYTAFFDPKAAGVAGNYTVKVAFEGSTPELGMHTCTKLIPVYVPQRKNRQ